ncbi:MAG TPA: ElyC/SanA/YdcF family protein [Patescibacteria group bacterium]|nr:ElyC/SanA/YdcF family protein [Patescibacteria group bacterium]
MQLRKTIFIILTIISFSCIIYIIAIPALIIQKQKKNIYQHTANIDKNYQVGIVFGAGIRPGGIPSDILEDRLDVAAKLYRENRIQKILVSGDNRTPDYDEPGAMYNYLVNTQQIPKEDIVRDYAGLRTYDTCIRAKEIWDVEEALLITQGFHLLRALFTCNALGVQSAGYSATQQEYQEDLLFKLREVLAIHNAVLDIYFLHPSYVGGEKESIDK